MSLRNPHYQMLFAAGLLALLVSGCDSSSIPGIADFNATVQTEQGDPHFYAGFVATQLNLDGGITVPIPDLNNSTVGISPSLATNGQAAGTVFQFDVDLATLPEFTNSEMAGLPDGRGLPDVSGGQLPRSQFTANNVDIYVYLSNSVFGLFIPLNLEVNGVPLPTTISEELDDSKGNLVGEAYAIPAEGGGTSSGLLFLIPFTANTPPAQTNSPN